MKNFFFTTDQNYTGLIARVTAGAIMFPHGAQKVLGWFGGAGYSGTIDVFAAYFNLLAFVSMLVIIIEFAGSLALLAGFAGRLWAMLMIPLVFGMIMTSTWQNGFFMNWLGNQKGEGIEFHLLYLGLLLILLLSGSGKWSVDRLFSKVLQPQRSSCGL